MRKDAPGERLCSHGLWPLFRREAPKADKVAGSRHPAAAHNKLERYPRVFWSEQPLEQRNVIVFPRCIHCPHCVLQSHSAIHSHPTKGGKDTFEFLAKGAFETTLRVFLSIPAARVPLQLLILASVESPWYSLHIYLSTPINSVKGRSGGKDI